MNRKLLVFVGLKQSWLQLNNLELVLGIVLNFWSSVNNELNLKFKKFRAYIHIFQEVKLTKLHTMELISQKQ